MANEKLESIKGKIKYLPSILFHIFVVFVIIRAYAPFRLQVQPVLLKGLLSGSNRGYILPGIEMAPFKQVLPPNGTVTYLSDHPYAAVPEEEKEFRDNRLYLAPILVNPEPGEKNAIVNCSSQEIADQRLLETGYQWMASFAPGKGIAVKK